MKSVLMSIQPKWCELIASGKKTVEVRKTKPKLETPFKVYIYCTKGRGDCLWRLGGVWYDTQPPNERPNILDGKVIGYFVCESIDEFTKSFFDEQEERDTQEIIDFLDASCLYYDELVSYVGLKKFYGWYISDLVIYDEPRELSEFHSVGWKKAKNGVALTFEEEKTWQITRPPQSWCYVEEIEREKQA